jgi:hypothetical protein
MSHPTALFKSNREKFRAFDVLFSYGFDADRTFSGVILDELRLDAQMRTYLPIASCYLRTHQMESCYRSFVEGRTYLNAARVYDDLIESVERGRRSFCPKVNE